MADARRRRAHTNRKAPTRTNSSFFGTIKGLVTAPLNWFSAAGSDVDEFEDARDETGKRRRQGAPTSVVSESEDRPTPTKKQRVGSPNRDMDDSGSGMRTGYLDPPPATFSRRSIRGSTLSPRRSVKSIGLPEPTVVVPRVLSPLRKQFSRNMVIDEPARSLSQDVSMKSVASLSRGVSMDTHGIRRDNSMPPLSSKPSFKMRNSLTPQLTRETSEPPPVSALHAKPRFVRPPGGLSRKPSMTVDTTLTLGSLADGSRHTMSPVRSLNNNVLPRSAPPYETDVQRTIQELDVYKTPLVPSRLRKAASGGSAASLSSSGAGGITDMFRSKKGLVLMQDEKSPRLGKKGRKNLAQDGTRSKPYAGEGGMKRLLARHKKEIQENTEEKSSSSTPQERTRTPPPEVPPPPPPGKEIFAPIEPSFAPIASSALPPGGSSLRVGRTLTSRAHISRPKPSKLKYSASFDDDDEGMDENERDQEFKAFDNAARKAPTFSVPNGFSFAKEQQYTPAPTDLNAKEPPVSSLPFSLISGAPSKVVAPTATPPIFGSSSSKMNSGFKAPATMFSPLADIPPPVLRTDEVTLNARGMPDFFSKSKYVTEKQKEDHAPAMFNSEAPKSVPSFFNAPPKPLVVEEESPIIEAKEEASKPAENPFSFDRPSKTITAPSDSTAPSTSVFASFTPPPAAVGSSPFSFGAPSAPSDEAPAQNMFAQPPPAVEHKHSETTTKPVFGVPSQSAEKPQATSMFGNTPTEAPPAAAAFAFGKSPETPASTMTPSPLFGAQPPAATTSMFGNNATSEVKPPSPFTFGAGSSDSKTAVSLFGSTALTETKPASVSMFGNPASDSSKPSAVSSMFGSTPIETPKPSFGAASGQSSMFSLNKEPEKSGMSSPFSFGGAPSTPPVEPKKDNPFSFGQSTPAPPQAPASTGFAFGASAPSADTRSFSFGGTPRPVTPPNASNQDMDRMEESPTRDMGPTPTANDSRPTLNTGASLNFLSGTSNFGQPQSATTPVGSPFAFGVANPNPFGAKPEEPKPSFGFGQQSNPAPPAFGFGKPSEPVIEPQRTTSGSFTFGSPTPTNLVAPSPGFAFGGSGSSAFGGSQAGSSAPNSPSLGHQPAPFSFGAAPSSIAPSTSFGFGSSQPASPATPSAPLPQFGFGNGSTAPSSPFGGNAPLPAPGGGGGGGFTMGAAPAPAGGDNRAVRRLPQRRKR